LVKIGGQELGYSAVRLALNLGIAGFYVGVNVLGFVLWWWLVKLRRSVGPVRAPELESARGRGAV
jgi:hypothetical protein